MITSLKKHFFHFLATGFWSGKIPFAPGTFGSAVAIPLFYFFWDLPWPWYVGITVATFLFGIIICDIASKDLGKHDHPSIVIDEIAGMFITLYGSAFEWRSLLAGFLLFRLFDILKPWPIRTIDKQVKGGFGIMFDDVLAGFEALAVMLLLRYFELI